MVQYRFFFSRLLKEIIFLSLFFCVQSFAAPWLGLTFKKISYKNQIALEIKGVHPSSGGLSAGIAIGDKIISVDGTALTDVSVIQKRVVKAKVGDALKLGVDRAGKILSLNVKLTERPDDISSLTGSAIGSKAAAFGKNFYANAEKRQKKPKVTLLDFWATWCGPCRMTIPKLERLYEKLGKEGLEVIGVSSEAQGVLNDFYKEHPSPYPLYRDGDQGMWRRYGISAVPTLILLDGEGYILHVWSGVPNDAALEAAVRTAMK
jgi:thiol-disulfide isomerase/thioredoxin